MFGGGINRSTSSVELDVKSSTILSIVIFDNKSCSAPDHIVIRSFGSGCCARWQSTCGAGAHSVDVGVRVKQAHGSVQHYTYNTHLHPRRCI